MDERPPPGLRVSCAAALIFFLAEIAAGALLIALAAYWFWPRTTSDVQTVMDTQVAAWNRGDLDGFMAGYWKSDDLTFCSGTNITRGWQATLDRYHKRYKAEGKDMGQLKFSEVVVTKYGPDSAAATGRWQVKLADSAPRGLFMLMFQRLNGEWKITHDVTTSE